VAARTLGVGVGPPILLAEDDSSHTLSLDRAGDGSRACELGAESLLVKPPAFEALLDMIAGLGPPR